MRRDLNFLLALYLPAEMIVTDTQGRRTGYDPRSGVAYAEIPSSSYGTEYLAADEESTHVTEYKILDIEAPDDGQYTVEVIGTGAGTIGLDLVPIDVNGDGLRTTLADVVAPDSVSTYQVTYSSTPGDKSSIVRTAVFVPFIASAKQSDSPAPVCNSGTFTPVDVMFALDRSESFAVQNRIGRSKVAIIAFMDKIANTGEQVALTKFSKVVELSQRLTTDKQAVYNLLVDVPEQEGTAIGDAINAAADELLGPRHIAGHRPVLIVFSDGENTDGTDPLQQANAAKARGIRIFTVSSWENVDKDLLQKIASSPGDFYYTAGTHDMAGSAQVIADRVRCGY